MTALHKSRQDIESLVGRDKINDFFQNQRTVAAAIQAMAFAAWSQEPSADASKRRQRLVQAETYLAEAEQFSHVTKIKDPELYLKAARADVASAKAKVESAGAVP